MKNSTEILRQNRLFSADDKGATFHPLLPAGNGPYLTWPILGLDDDVPHEQLTILVGTRSKLQQILQHACNLSTSDRLLVIFSEDQAQWAKRQLTDEGAENSTVQKKDIGTGAVIALTIAQIMMKDPTALVMIYPSEPFIYPEKMLETYVKNAFNVCEERGKLKIILFGAEPFFTQKEMGWIVPGQPANSSGEFPMFRIERFVEKASPEETKDLIAQGAFWNTFIMVGKVSTFWYLIWKLLPEAGRKINGILRNSSTVADPTRLKSFINDIEPFRFTRRVLAQATSDLLVCPLMKFGGVIGELAKDFL